jgi:hypothetical protein
MVRRGAAAAETVGGNGVWMEEGVAHPNGHAVLQQGALLRAEQSTLKFAKHGLVWTAMSGLLQVSCRWLVVKHIQACQPSDMDPTAQVPMPNGQICR